MKVYIGRRLSGAYEIAISDRTLTFDKGAGLNTSLYSISTSKEFHKISSRRLRKGQMRTFDRIEFK